ncbi:MAG: hypothetical protein LBU32_05270 [Clostridiales bacterium]|nr:hypothetical protein [Clostridiales bacterium]
MDCAVYFRHPHSSFEKGADERHSGLPRRFAEKGRGAGGMPVPLYAKPGDLNSNLPRKILGCRTPAEMFEREPQNSAMGGMTTSSPPGPIDFRKLGKCKTSLWHLLHLTLQFILHFSD